MAQIARRILRHDFMQIKSSRLSSEPIGMAKLVHFNDPIHGQIEIDPVALAVIEHPYFQRLRRIKALGFLDRVFPSAKHSRFEHSIGVYHVARKFCESLRRGTTNLQDGANGISWNSSSEYTVPLANELNSFFTDARIRQITIAALLHDVGHGPFSHASEPLMPKKKKILLAENDIPPWLRDYFKNDLEDKVDHEDYSIVMMYLILKSLESKKIIDEEEIRCVISVKTGENLTSDKSLKKDFPIFQRIVDGEFDADRMDYVQRDSLFCGVPYGKFDMDRVFDGLCFIKNKDQKIEIALKRSSLGAFEDFLFARYQMHVQVYTHRVDVACNSSFKKISAGNPLPGNIEEYVKWDDESFVFMAPSAMRGALKETLLKRQLWKTVYECFEQDQSAAIVICKRISDEIGETYVAQNPTDKPFRKEDLLKLQIITKDISGRLFTQKVKAISDIIGHYNTSYFALRLCVSPEKAQAAQDILDSFHKNKKRKFGAAGNAIKNLTKRPSDPAFEISKTRTQISAIEKRKRDRAKVKKTSGG